MTGLQKKIIASAASFLKRHYRRESSGHDWFHLERVWKSARFLAKGESVDMFVLEMAALLHDVDDYKYKKAGEPELSRTRTLLAAHPIGERTKRHILSIVANVSYKGAGVATPQPTREGKIVQDADRLDALGAIGIARVFAYGGYAGYALYDPAVEPKRHRTFAGYRSGSKTVINHFYEKLLLIADRLNTPGAKAIAERRHKYLISFLDEFFAEVEGRA